MSATGLSNKLRINYGKVRAETLKLCEPLKTEDFVPQPDVNVSPPKWNIAHTTWFFEEMILKPFVPRYQEFNPAFGSLFNSYYNAFGNRTKRENRGDLSRPTVDEIFEYRRYVDERMDELLAAELPPEVAQMVILGLNHEQQHQELLLTDLKYMLSLNPLYPIYKKDFALVEICEDSSPDFVDIAEGVYEIGYAEEGFHFDNESGRHKVYLNDFSICRKLVTNAEYLEFIEDGGYRDFRFWHSEGWDWINQNDVSCPLYWQRKDDKWWNFTLAGLRKLSPEAPVAHVSFYEAAAFAEWKKCRLPTEFEWETASEKFDWGLRWEWTNSAYLPYPNFKKSAGAVGEYNGKFMVNQMILRGASAATPAGHSRQTYRNFFHAPFRWQFTGIRLAK